MKEKYKLLEFAIIEKAVAGDFLAMEKVIAYFHRYMIFWAKQNGVINYAYLEEKRLTRKNRGPGFQASISGEHECAKLCAHHA